MKGESDFGLRAGIAFFVAHTIVCFGAGYFLGFIEGTEEGVCRITCEEATAGEGSGHVMAEGCTCSITDTAGDKTTWVEKPESAP